MVFLNRKYLCIFIFGCDYNIKVKKDQSFSEIEYDNSLLTDRINTRK